MMNNGSLQLDETLSKGKIFGDVSRLGYNKTIKPSQVIDVDGSDTSKDYKQVSLHYRASESTRSKKKFTSICYFCEKQGHIRPYWQEYHRYIKSMKRSGLEKGKTW